MDEFNPTIITKKTFYIKTVKEYLWSCICGRREFDDAQIIRPKKKSETIKLHYDLMEMVPASSWKHNVLHNTYSCNIDLGFSKNDLPGYLTISTARDGFRILPESSTINGQEIDLVAAYIRCDSRHDYAVNFVITSNTPYDITELSLDYTVKYLRKLIVKTRTEYYLYKAAVAALGLRDLSEDFYVPEHIANLKPRTTTEYFMSIWADSNSSSEPGKTDSSSEPGKT